MNKKTASSNIDAAIKMFRTRITLTPDDITNELKCKVHPGVIAYQCRMKGLDIRSLRSGRKVISYTYVPATTEHAKPDINKPTHFEDLGWEESFDPVNLRDLGL